MKKSWMVAGLVIVAVVAGVVLVGTAQNDEIIRPTRMAHR